MGLLSLLTFGYYGSMSISELEKQKNHVLTVHHDVVQTPTITNKSGTCAQENFNAIFIKELKEAIAKREARKKENIIEIDPKVNKEVEVIVDYFDKEFDIIKLCFGKRDTIASSESQDDLSFRQAA